MCHCWDSCGWRNHSQTNEAYTKIRLSASKFQVRELSIEHARIFCISLNVAFVGELVIRFHALDHVTGAKHGDVVAVSIHRVGDPDETTAEVTSNGTWTPAVVCLPDQSVGRLAQDQQGKKVPSTMC